MSLSCLASLTVGKRVLHGASRKAGELSAIESAVTVVISELLSVCVARSGSAAAVIASDLTVCVDNLYRCYCSSVLRVYGIFVSKSSFSLTLLVGLFSPYTHRTECRPLTPYP
ncbi:hypothetical protein AVEN_139646-1 [Araneus ventricosus]|uniref:Uncharacterized protein n=1 Tax=Araneus ventricosus TaxID=182803 RepID=A0A4Y2FWC4_ARAVE|nr:hypothetical protein AVEN_139646-1 [Araneus ventricosus]